MGLPADVTAPCTTGNMRGLVYIDWMTASYIRAAYGMHTASGEELHVLKQSNISGKHGFTKAFV